jgi:hypothetical protein
MFKQIIKNTVLVSILGFSLLIIVVETGPHVADSRTTSQRTIKV